MFLYKSRVNFHQNNEASFKLVEANNDCELEAFSYLYVKLIDTRTPISIIEEIFNIYICMVATSFITWKT